MNRSTFLRLATAWLPALATVTLATAQPEPGDAQITIAVETELLRDDAVPFDRIDVSTEDRIVSLTGRVSSLAARLQAERRASIVRGVRSVINRIDVEVPQRPLAELEAAIVAALKADPATDAYEVDAVVNDGGRVVLTGAVDSAAERSLVEAVVMTVPGVAAIEDRLTVTPREFYGGGAEIAAQIEGLLHWDTRVNDALVRVRVLEGNRVIMSGTVGSFAEKRLAEQLAWLPSGVRSVDAQHLDVQPWAQNDELQLGERVPPSDADARAALEQTLAFDPRVSSAPVEVHVEDGTAWLRGSVDNVPAKRAAERDAYNTLGIERVRNHLKVRPELLTDDVIAASVSEALESRGLLERNDIVIGVDDARVRLTGDVQTSQDYWEVDRVAASARGARDIANEITVRGMPPIMASYSYYPKMLQRSEVAEHTDREIYDDIRSELFWSPFVDAEQVDIVVEDGVATLTGRVDSLRERRTAVDNALEAGAVAVRNELLVE